MTTTRVTHATPAGTYANTAERNWEGDSDMTHVTGGCKDIALQLIEENPDIQVHDALMQVRFERPSHIYMNIHVVT